MRILDPQARRSVLNFSGCAAKTVLRVAKYLVAKYLPPFLATENQNQSMTPQKTRTVRKRKKTGTEKDREKDRDSHIQLQISSDQFETVIDLLETGMVRGVNEKWEK